MPIQTGTHTIADLAANRFASELVYPSNIDAMNEAIQRDLDVHNQRVQEITSVFVERSTERSTVYGTNASLEFHQADEFTRGPTQKPRVGGKVDFPLDKFQLAVGWTADYLKRATVQDMARTTIAVRQADLRNISNQIRNAFFGPTNYTWVDRLRDNNSLAVKRLVNADSAAIPNGPNGESFDGATHTHYLASDWSGDYADEEQIAEDLEALVHTVVEHGHAEGLTIFINIAQDSAVRSAPGFSPLLVPNVIAPPGGTQMYGQGTLDTSRVDNRRIGFFNGFPVETRSWVPAGYILATATSDPQKPLRMRVSEIPSENGLHVAGTIITHPLQAQYMENFFGIGVKTRTNGAVLYTGGEVYVAPTIS